MDVLDQVYAGYGEIRPHGTGPSQSRLMEEGNAYLEAEYPELDFIESAEIIEPASQGDS